MNKRAFLKSLAAPIILPNLGFTSNLNSELKGVISDEEFWQNIRKDYDLKSDYINLENGYYCIQPKTLQNAFLNNVKDINREGSYYMRTRRFDENIEIRKELAEIAGCNFEEIIVTRNTTESIDTVISGYDWKKDDEAIMAEQDYGAMLEHFDLQTKRYGLKKIMVSVPLHPKSDEEIVEIYEKAISPKTRLLMVSHMINITGQILPIKKICDMAHKYGVDVIVDGAHAFAHINFKISDLNCDYYATSLHKWLNNPLGAGMLYVRKDKIKNLWPIFGDNGYADDDIRKLNHTGTPAVHTDISIKNSIAYLKNLVIDKKEARLRYLQEYWTSKVRQNSKIVVNTPKESHRACGIANVGIKGLKPNDLAKTLLEKYKIWTVAIDGAGVHGCRITPNLYTNTKELDMFVNALNKIANS
jgi:selenocysteine lyase/cysteine desulfurase